MKRLIDLSKDDGLPVKTMTKPQKPNEPEKDGNDRVAAAPRRVFDSSELDRLRETTRQSEQAENDPPYRGWWVL